MSQLVLSDGTVFRGEAFGAPTDADGEVVFNTGMAGYPESLTDPSYRGQILVFTYPLIGNYGVPSTELNEWGFSKYLESEHIHVRGVICAQVSEHYSHHEAVQSLDAWMKEEGIPGITGVDTRMLTKKLREKGVMLGRISGSESGSGSEITDPNASNLVAEVSCTEILRYEPLDSAVLSSSPSRSGAEAQDREATQPRSRKVTIVAFDCGMKRNIIRSFLKRGVTVIRVPWDFDLKSADFAYDGVFVSNGPGDPEKCDKTIEQIRWSIEQKIPTFGICLGNQIMALAVGGKTYKLPYGHRGVNQPCQEWEVVRDKREMSSRCIITSQNHGFAVDAESLPAGWNVWFTNANDGTVEGIRHESGPFFAVQFHPEATPGPEDANYLFDEFLEVVEEERRKRKG